MTPPSWPKIADHEVICQDSLSALAEEIKKGLLIGWHPIGTSFSTFGGGTFCQALVKYHKENA